MNAAAVEDLASTIPDELLPEFFSGGRVPAFFAGGMDMKLAKFLAGYRDPGFGWKFAQVFARANIPLPPLEPEDEPLLQAWLYCRDPRMAAPAFQRALSLTNVFRRNSERTVRALLMPKQATTSDVARAVRMDPEAVNIYGKLFFNVIDRRDDILYIQDIVYPNGRAAEFMREQYREDEVGQLMLRAGYDNGMEDVIHLAGLNDATEMIASAESSAKLEKLMMATAAVMASTGMISHTRQHPLINSARQLLAAGKIGGADTGGDSEGLSQMGSVLKAELIRARLGEVRATEARKQKAEADAMFAMEAMERQSR